MHQCTDSKLWWPIHSTDTYSHLASLFLSWRLPQCRCSTYSKIFVCAVPSPEKDQNGFGSTSSLDCWALHKLQQPQPLVHFLVTVLLSNISLQCYSPQLYWECPNHKLTEMHRNWNHILKHLQLSALGSPVIPGRDTQQISRAYTIWKFWQNFKIY